jgi:hypothetical protein
MDVKKELLFVQVDHLRVDVETKSEVRHRSPTECSIISVVLLVPFKALLELIVGISLDLTNKTLT